MIKTSNPHEVLLLVFELPKGKSKQLLEFNKITQCYISDGNHTVP